MIPVFPWHLLYKQYQKQTLFIVTNKAEAISQLIYDTTVHGATIIDCEGAHKHSEHTIVYSVVSRDENNSVIRAVREADPQAFSYFQNDISTFLFILALTF